MQEAPFSVSFSPGKPPLVTVRGETAEVWTANMDAADKSGALAKIRAINDSLNGVTPAAVVAAATASTVNPGQPAQELPAGFAGVPCSTCGAVTRFAQEGTSSKSGKPYKRYSCTADSTHKSTFTD